MIDHIAGWPVFFFIRTLFSDPLMSFYRADDVPFSVFSQMVVFFNLERLIPSPLPPFWARRTSSVLSSCQLTA